jgi:hypothetical protein
MTTEATASLICASTEEVLDLTRRLLEDGVSFTVVPLPRDMWDVRAPAAVADNYRGALA